MHPARENNFYIRAFYYHEQVFWLVSGFGHHKKTDLSMPFQDRIGRRILPIPPAPALLGEFLIEIHVFEQNYIGNGTSILVVAVGLDGDIFPKARAEATCFAFLP